MSTTEGHLRLLPNDESRQRNDEDARLLESKKSRFTVNEQFPQLSLSSFDITDR